MKKNKDINDEQKVFAHAPIQWYPGHMAKAKREIGEAVKKVDVVMELVDSRIPVASRNPVLNEIIGNKPRIIVMNKADLANREETKKWISYYQSKGQVAVEVNSSAGNGVKNVLDAAYEMMKEKLEKKEKQGLLGASIKVMVVGIPNVGKSSFINKVAGKQTTATGNKPGVTQKNQWVRLNDRIQLLDTPGVLWPKFDDEKLARHLAYIGTIKDTILDVEDLAYHLVVELLTSEKEKLFERYKIESDFAYEEPIEVLDKIGKNRGCLVRGGEIDYTKVGNIILDDFRTAKIGNITLEKVEK